MTEADQAPAGGRQIARLALPALGVLAAEPLYLLFDTAVVGRLGALSLAGLAVGGRGDGRLKVKAVSPCRTMDLVSTRLDGVVCYSFTSWRIIFASSSRSDTSSLMHAR